MVAISFRSCQAIFTAVLGTKLAGAKMFPKLINFEQKQHRTDTAQEMLTTFNNDPDLLKELITGDESRVLGYDLETKAYLKLNTGFFDPFFRTVKNRRAHQNMANLFICQKQTDNPKWQPCAKIEHSNS